MSALRELCRRGDTAIWFAGTGLGISVLMIAAMIVLILSNGLGFFWPRQVALVTLETGGVETGETSGREAIPAPGSPEHLARQRIQLKLGNRDLTGVDFPWVREGDIARIEYPADALYIERPEYGPFIGRAVRLVDGERELARGGDATLWPCRRCWPGRPRVVTLFAPWSATPSAA